MPSVFYKFRSITNYREIVFENLKRDIADSREFVTQFTQTQDIYDRTRLEAVAQGTADLSRDGTLPREVATNGVV